MRTQRKLSKETKDKMAQAKLNTKQKEETKKKISESLKKYWENIPYENNSEENKN